MKKKTQTRKAAPRRKAVVKKPDTRTVAEKMSVGPSRQAKEDGAKAEAQGKKAAREAEEEDDKVKPLPPTRRFVPVGEDVVYDGLIAEIEDLKTHLALKDAEINRLKREVDAYDRLATLLKAEREKAASTTEGIRHPVKTEDIPMLDQLEPLPSLDDKQPAGS